MSGVQRPALAFCDAIGAYGTGLRHRTRSDVLVLKLKFLKKCDPGLKMPKFAPNASRFDKVNVDSGRWPAYFGVLLG